MVSDYLGAAGFRVDARRHRRRRARAAGAPTAFDALVLDLMLPDMDGLDVCRQHRAPRARHADPDADRARRRHGPRRRPRDGRRRLPAEAVRAARAAGARSGRILRRRTRRGRASVLRFGRLEIDRGAREVRLDGEPRPLTATSSSCCSCSAAARRPRAVARRDDGLCSRPSRWRRSTARSTCTSRASAPPSRTIRRSRAASSPCAAPATCSPRRRTDAADARLYHQIYLTIIASLLLVVLVGRRALALRDRVTRPPIRRSRSRASSLRRASGASRTPRRRPSSRRSTGCTRRLGIDLALFDAQRRRSPRPAAAAHRRPRRAKPAAGSTGRGGPAWAIRLPDGRWIVARPPLRHAAPAVGHRRLPRRASRWRWRSAPIRWCAGLTRRLERLQTGVETLGAGELSARVEVEGSDEVARLAESFNRSAARIEELVARTSMLLANASHELRTPLSRIRLGIEFLKGGARPSAQGRRSRSDIAELDGLIEQILLFEPARGDKGVETTRTIDLLGARGGGGGSLRALLRHRYSRCRHGQSCPAAADGSQSARQCRTAWCAADPGRCAPSGGQGRSQRRRSWCRS